MIVHFVLVFALVLSSLYTLFQLGMVCAQLTRINITKINWGFHVPYVVTALVAALTVVLW